MTFIATTNTSIPGQEFSNACQYAQVHSQGISHAVNHFALSGLTKRVPAVGAEQILSEVPSARICLHFQPPGLGTLDGSNGALVKCTKKQDARLRDAILRVNSPSAVEQPDNTHHQTRVFTTPQLPGAYSAPHTETSIDPISIVAATLIDQKSSNANKENVCTASVATPACLRDRRRPTVNMRFLSNVLNNQNYSNSRKPCSDLTAWRAKSATMKLDKIDPPSSSADPRSRETCENSMNTKKGIHPSNKKHRTPRTSRNGVSKSKPATH
ncbi:hypothetical protein PHLCEN_2v12675 [Hermanssonia centrifuga]|uniref:Uncharacterized protein n=1 Tax=Hermanssonia centrifuga TaxID=98765 RepID=A0A2R6NGP2_9APHY|nr:hypothetical protein PHLCEN_2v12675 [Hermanssonia centrifuga]